MTMESGPVVLATDLSPEARRAYAPAVELARIAGAEVVLVYVYQSLTEPNGPEDFADELELARTRLADELGELPDDLPKSAHALAGTRVAAALSRFAIERDARCIVLSTHGNTGLRHLVLGSTAEAVTRHASVPVIVVPPPDTVPEENPS